mmetsp:Transcript_20610/g.34215  ORF Transcript_20610/g.34215 Transcript_20610/m.34215 type:complete len:86 (+) Transcript_20610:708-965(+)
MLSLADCIRARAASVGVLCAAVRSFSSSSYSESTLGTSLVKEEGCACWSILEDKLCMRRNANWQVRKLQFAPGHVLLASYQKDVF